MKVEDFFNLGKQMQSQRVDVYLIEKQIGYGLTFAEATKMYELLNDDMAYPIEIDNANGESSAMGFISQKGAEKIDYAYHGANNDGLYEFISAILANMELENPLGIYEFNGLKIFLTR